MAGSHSIQLYSDISAEPVRACVGDRDRQSPANTICRFEKGLNLSSDSAAQFGNVMGGDQKFPVLAHAVDLGQTQTIPRVAWAVGLVRDPVVTYNGVKRRPYFLSQYATVGNAIDAFMGQFPKAVARATKLDREILQHAGAVSRNYMDLVSLATRQAMAGVEITVSATHGEWDVSDVQAFMKDVGNTQCVGPSPEIAGESDRKIYAALPAFMYLNASLIGLLLEPMLRFQNSSEYNNPYAAPDLGTFYPEAPGNPNNNTIYGVENCGNMLILALAHARTSGDGSLISKYYALLKGWAEYLGTNSLIPEQQHPADARLTSLAQNHGNITNLALKGIIAIQAMSEISRSLGKTTDAQKYEVYAAESRVLSGNSAPAFGFPLSTDNWTLFSAATVPDTGTRDLLISAVHKQAGSNATLGPFPNLYNLQTGANLKGFASTWIIKPAQGAMFAILALKWRRERNNYNTSSGILNIQFNPCLKLAQHTGAIVGGVLGSFAAVILVAGLAVFFRRRGTNRTAPQSYRPLLSMTNANVRV
ncbi:hypothetical protein B0H13DRAFT_1936225 [Mycena leptocephala]|nr:hypothetical protein B0H13DRAFT_1936225 [Mycena leptocephala]